jgi:hypothetical protein
MIIARLIVERKKLTRTYAILVRYGNSPAGFAGFT